MAYETKIAFWKRMKNYNSLYTGRVCKNSKNHEECSDCMYWTLRSHFPDISTKGLDVIQYNCANFWESKDKELTICARQKPISGVKIDLLQ